MIVCICNNVNDTTIRTSGKTLDELGVGMVCGRCMETAQEIYNEANARGGRRPQELEVPVICQP